jgi:DNA invertase Pin-like site-specific DNA recombinase
MSYSATTSGNPQQLRLVLAARKSNKVTDGNGRELRSIGIETQDERGREWADLNKHIIVDVAADVKSGKVAPWDRPELRPWVKDPERMALYDGILATSNDRLSRGCWADEARIRLWAEENGKRLIIVNGPQWPPRDAGDEWSWEANAKHAAAEWEHMQERIRRAQAKLREGGKFMGRPPFGYQSVGVKYDHWLVPTDDGRAIIPELFGRVIDGESLAMIAAWLYEVTGRRWWASSINKLVRCPTYMGHRCEWDEETKTFGRTLSRNEPLVNAAIWAGANKALSNRPKHGPRNVENRAPLTTALFCGNCDDSPMYRKKSGNPEQYRKSQFEYYWCTGRGAGRKSCGNTVRRDVLEPAVDRIIAASWDTPVRAHTVIPGNEAKRDARLAEIQFETGQLASMDLEDDEYEQRHQALRAERRELMNAVIVPDTIEYTETGDRYAALWLEVEPHQRGPWLARNGFKILATKRLVTVTNGEFTATEDLPA